MSITRLKGKKIAILGLRREGSSTLKLLKKNKIKADVLDVKFDKSYIDRIKNYDIIFRTPGFPRIHPALIAAEKNGTIISSHIKLFFDLCPARVIGITGTKGKTTTAFLIYEVLKTKFHKKVFIAGNVGSPALDILPKLKKDSIVVLELSSFQLQDLHKSPDVVVITNLTLDHMDPSGKFAPSTHQSAKEYFDAKMNILRHQGNNDFSIIHPSLKNKTRHIGQGKKNYPVPLLVETKLRGKHNLENIALAVAVGKIFKVPQKNILKAVKNFKGIKHRLEFVKKINGISFYNDSAATNPDATLAALKSFKESIHLILGGSDKGLDYKNLAGYISKSKNIKTIALIGQIKEKLYKILKPKPELEIKKIKNLKEAVLTLYKKADKNEIVLMSPAAASFDIFQNYAERGNEFRKLVKQLER
ncbi:MAG: hypothetical protein A2913_00155 [Parcubacteria group bacterium RIFCSPLOWO2_01_FULL_40_65]|nr:MAG: hypothetical protein A2734_00270 [Parcubacteria group bacterium RIFCSPHIGHO2_01_FULL_40_30]OHB19328.1 MAG: hypothetical protein A3D40_00240 [Parcubacteria group bacterium RIFCSPHIGHO2_02_FULL_40_12]OHB21215.1 MAG: hypothetical protein A2913_00155 [Parcubacteria group bacterium RIFCSPLOWO2_01_FULL_40_65]OHB22944.1 MAG: hypothetical protein A3I22_00725 [Parcubacteria group bacterium RIFCSPLOWO2_02_FULL_40_12]OHB23842.1 MAG: hypothetical protein A3F96_02435 [Parcubacteria group bacterium R